MEKALENLYGKLQDENLNLMVKHLSKDKDAPYSKEILINHALLIKVKQMIDETNKIPMSNY